MKRRRGVQPPDDLAAFYADQHGRVYGALVLFTGNRSLAEELAQEAFVRACEHWEKVRTLDSPGAWVHRVGINLAISRARRARNERHTVARLQGQRTTVPGPDEGFDGHEALRAGLAALPDDDRAVVVLRHHVDLSVAEVARILAIPEGTVKTRNRRALAALRAHGIRVPAMPDEHDDETEHEEVVS